MHAPTVDRMKRVSVYHRIDNQFGHSYYYKDCKYSCTCRSEGYESQIFSPADSAILLNDSLSKRFIIDMLPAGMFPPMAPRAIMLRVDGLSAGNMMCVLSRSRSSFLYIPPFASDVGLT